MNLATEKMVLLGQMVAGIAHEINTPASAINAANTNVIQQVQGLIDVFTAMDQLALNGDELRRLMAIIRKMASDLDTQHRKSSSAIREEQKRLVNVLERQGVSESGELARQLARMELGEYLDEVLALAETCELNTILPVLTHCHRIFRSLVDIQVSVGVLMHDVRALKSYAHPGQMQPEVLDVHETLDVALTVLKNQLKHRFQVVRRYGDIPPIAGYASELSHVWINLLHNAIQAIDGNGRIVIETFVISPDVGIRIIDNGPGIAPEIQKKIFDPQFTTKSQGEGSGLGLALVQQILAKHHGTITVDSEPGNTVFEVRLPQSPPSA